MKDPAFLFYSSDFLSGTMTMTNNQVGIYIRLLCLQHQKGYLREKDILYFCGEYDEDIFSKFHKDSDGNYYNMRLKDETERRIKYTESRRRNLNSKPHMESDIVDDMSSHMDNHMEAHMETETVTETITKTDTENEAEIKEKKQLQKKMILEFFETMWKRYPRKKGKDGVSFTQKEKLFKLGPEIILTCIDRYELDIKTLNIDEKHIQYGSTFFNGGYVDFLDENYQAAKAAPVNKKIGNVANFPGREIKEDYFAGAEEDLSKFWEDNK